MIQTIAALHPAAQIALILMGGLAVLFFIVFVLPRP